MFNHTFMSSLFLQGRVEFNGIRTGHRLPKMAHTHKQIVNRVKDRYYNILPSYGFQGNKDINI